MRTHRSAFPADIAPSLHAADSASSIVSGSSIVMTEIVLGLLAILAAVAVAFGFAQALVPLPFGHAFVTTAMLLGLALILRGTYRLKRRASGDQPALRSLGLAGIVAGLTIVTALAIPAISETLNIVSIAGFPVGLYMMGQGALIFFVVLLFVYAARQNRIENRIDDADNVP